MPESQQYVTQKTANETKWEKVHSVDNYWHSLWEEPKTRLTDAQLKEVERFWSKYSFAYKIDPRVQEHFSSLSGSFNPLYCNNGLNYYYMFRFYDSPVYHTPFHDKNYREFLFHDVAYTPAYLHRVCGNYYDQNFNPISYDKAMSILADLVSEQEEKLIVKPTPGGGGSDISFIRRGDSKEKIAELLDGIPQKWISNISLLSLCLYLNHYVWINTLQNWKVAVPFWHVFYIYLILSFLTALTCFFTVKYIGLLLESHKARKAADPK